MADAENSVQRPALSAERLHRWLRVAPALAGISGAVYIALVAIDARPIADDWWFIFDARHWGFATYMHNNLAGSGRFSQFALAWPAARLLGAAAVNLTPVVLLALAVGFGASVLRGLAGLLHARVGRIQASFVALLALVSCIATAPSLYDTVGWFAAVVAYLAGVVAALAVVALGVTLLTRERRLSPWIIAGVGLLAAIVGGFHELVGVILTLAGLLAILTVRNLQPEVAGWQPPASMAVVALGAAIGTAANIFGPGAQSRAQAQGAHISLTAAVNTAVRNLSFLRADLHAGVLLLALATGVVVWQALGAVADVRARRWLCVWTTFLLVVPWSVTAALTAWAGSTESGDRSPFRAAFVGTGSVALAIALGVWLLLSLYPVLLSELRASMLALVFAAAGTFALAHKATPILRAELMRAAVVDARGTSIKSQYASNNTTITLAAAPLLTVFTQAYDLSFDPTHKQRSGWVSALRQYYRIPRRDTVSVSARQPRDYCLSGVSAPWVGVQSCQELDAQRAGG